MAGLILCGDMKQFPSMVISVMAKSALYEFVSQLQLSFTTRLLLQGFPSTEVLRKLNQAQNMLHSFNKREQEIYEDADTFKKLCKQFDHAWFYAQEYYIRYETRGIIVTAASAMTKATRYFRPDYLMIDEASQLADHNVVPVMSRFY